MNSVEDYYNNQYDEWSRLERHRIEFEITKRAIDNYIEPGSEVLDIGGGPGRYSIYLAQKGHDVTLLDLSQMLVEQAAENAGKAGVAIRSFIKGNVLELERLLPDKLFDAILCMGPMYHLLEENERREALSQCIKCLKQGGILVASFISAYAPIVCWLKDRPNVIKEQKDQFLKYLTDGRNNTKYGFTDAYFIDPEKIEELTSDFKLRKLRLMAVEGLGALVESSLMQLPEEEFQEWLELFYRISENRVVWGASEHLLYVGRKL